MFSFVYIILQYLSTYGNIFFWWISAKKGRGVHWVAFVCLFSCGAFLIWLVDKFLDSPCLPALHSFYYTGTPEGKDPHSPLTAQGHDTGGSRKRSISANVISPGTQPGASQPWCGVALGMLHWSPPCLPLPPATLAAQGTCCDQGSWGSLCSPAG